MIDELMLREAPAVLLRRQAARPAPRRAKRVFSLRRLLLELCALTLDLPEDFFAAKVDRQISGLRLRNNPAPDPAAPPPRPGQLRVGPHSGFGTLACPDLQH
eukprot:COSAG06_NODE_4193_length_4489_cov_2.539180_1_plen_102_part_00